MSETKIRQLQPPEWLLLQELLIRQFGESLPDPAQTRIFGMEVDGALVGFVQIEAVEAIHIRHVYVDPEHRGNGNGTSKAEELVDHVRGLFAQSDKRAHLVATTPFAEYLAAHAGMKKIEGSLWEGDGK